MQNNCLVGHTHNTQYMLNCTQLCNQLVSNSYQTVIKRLSNSNQTVIKRFSSRLRQESTQE